MLVFLHEGLGSIGQWRDFPALLAEALGLPALIYDRWGHGESDPLDRPRPVDWLHQEALVVLPEVLAATHVRDVILIGHSDGGSIALIYAGDEAARREVTLRAVVTLAAHVLVEDETLAGLRALRAAYDNTELKQRLARYHGDKTDSMFRGLVDVWLLPEFRNFRLDDYLRGIRSPVLALQGSQDEYGTAAQLELISKECGGPVETALIPGCGHSPHHQAREETLARIATFLQ